jgi:hypothetical protein
MPHSLLTPLIVDRKQTCALLAIGKNRFWDLIRTGELEVVGGLPGKTRVSYASVKAFAENPHPHNEGTSDRAARMRVAKAAKRAALTAGNPAVAT